LIYVLQVAWRNLVIFAHNFIIVAGVLLIFGVKDWLAVLLFVPGLVIYLLNAMWIAALIGLLAARFRDLPQIVSALLQIGFYITPILFSGRMLTAQHRWIVEWNPLAYLIDIVREPLLGNVPPASAWGVSLAMMLFGWILALAVTGRYYKRIPFWV
jgi:lipopolysaccharide transport system permease protein